MRKALCLAFIILSLSPLYPRDIILPQDEAPESLFSLKLGDVDTDLFLSGSWKARAEVGAGFNLSRGAGFSYSAFPGLNSGFLFSQSPDILLSLWLMGKYFFEASFVEGYTLNTFLLGFDGEEEDFIQSVRIGNTETSISPLPFFPLPEASPSSLGGSIRTASKNFSFEGMVRFDPAAEQKIVYKGQYLLSEHRIPLPGYIRNRFFIIPGAPLSGPLILLIENNSGNITIENRTYSPMDAGSYAYSLQEGTLDFKEPLKARVIISYKSIPWDTDLGEGETLADYRLFGEGRDYLLLFDPGSYNPMERRGLYQVPEDIKLESLTEVFLVKKGETEGIRIEFSANRDDNILALKGTGPLDILDHNSFSPFKDEFPQLYGPSAYSAVPAFNGEILVQLGTYSENYEIPENLLPGSLRIFRNGLETKSYIIENERIMFNIAPGSGERIELTFRTYETKALGGDLLAAAGGEISINPETTLKYGTGFRWNIAGDYAETPEDNPGSLLISAALEGKRGSFSYSLETGASLSTPNTTGTLLLFGMGDHRLKTGISDNTIFPSSVPETDSATTAENRGKLFYSDYRLYNSAGGSVLQNYTWTPPEEQIFDYVTGNRPGPALAYTKTGDPFSGEVLIMDYHLQGGEWAGAQVSLSKNQIPPDLSSYTSLSLYWQGEGDFSGLEYRIEAGSIGEDLDEDGILDREESVYSKGFAFNHGSTVLLVGGGPKGTGNGYLDSEDFDGNGVLDRDNTLGIISVVPDELPGKGSFTKLEIPLTEELRNRLTRVPFIRIIIKNPDSQEARGRILAGNILFSGSSFNGKAEDPGTISAAEINTTGPVSGEALTDLFPEAGIFTESGGTEKVLAVDWSNLNGEAVITGYTAPVSAGLYGTIIWFMRFPEESNDGLSVTLAYSGGSGGGYSCTFTPPAETGWSKYELALSEPGVLRINGEEHPAEIDISPADYLSALSFTFRGTASGRVHIDTIYLKDPKTTLAGAVKLGLAYNHAGEILSWKGISLLKDFSISQDITLKSGAFALGFMESGTQQLFSYTRTEVTFLGLKLNGGLSLSLYPEGLNWQGSHSIILPLPGLILRDSFLYGGGINSGDYSRSNSLQTSALPFNWGLSSETALISKTLNQTWKSSFSYSSKSWGGISISAELHQASSEYAAPEKDYINSWIGGFKLILPFEDDPWPKRRGSLLLQTNGSRDWFGFSFIPLISYISEGTGLREHTSYGKGILSFPLRFYRESPREWGLMLQYSREFSSTDTALSSDFYEDAVLIGKAFIAAPFLLESVPFYEIFDQGLMNDYLTSQEGIRKGFYKPEAVLSLYFPAGSFWYNLFIPTSIELSVNQVLEKDGDAVSRIFSQMITARSMVLNLFGRFGLYPIFKLYRTEELVFSGSLLWEMEELGFTPDTYKLILQHSLTFFGESKRKLSIENHLILNLEDYKSMKEEGEFTYSWASPAAVIPDKIKERYPASFIHSETLSVKYYSSQDSTNVSSLSVFPLHKTSLLLENLGDIALWGGFGFYNETYPGLPEAKPVLLFGLNLGIEVNFRF